MKTIRRHAATAAVLLLYAVIGIGCSESPEEIGETRQPAEGIAVPVPASATPTSPAVTAPPTVLPASATPEPSIATESPSVAPLPTATSVPVENTPTPEPELTLLGVEEIRAQLQGLPLDAFFEISFKHLLLRDPALITSLGISGSLGVRNDRLNDLSESFVKETQALQIAILELLREYDRQELSEQQQLSYDVYEWYLDDQVRGHAFMYHDYSLHHSWNGYHLNLTTLLTELHPLKSRADVEDYIARISQVDDQVAQLLEGLRRREELGVVPPMSVVIMTRQTLAAYLQMDGDDPSTIRRVTVPVFTIFDEKLRLIDAISDDDKRELRERALDQVQDAFIPAYLSLIEYLDQLEAVVTEGDGVWKLPDGEAYYAYLLRHMTSTNMSAAEIHELGLAAVARIQGEMESVFDSLGYPREASFGEKMQRAIQEAGSLDASTVEARDQVVATYEAIIGDIETRLDGVIDVRPTTDLAIIPELSASGGGFYEVGSLDGTRPGAFHVGVGTSQTSRFGMASMTYHEAVPGHHFQLALARELEAPLFRRALISNAFEEGWALYAEQLAWELGVYEDDPYGDLGRLSLELLRAIRLVADTGINAYGWTQEEAMAYMTESMGSDRYAPEVHRYITWPGQATGYYTGLVELLRLRQRAMEVLGDKYDPKDFHRALLTHGDLPLELLENLVDRYIDEKLLE